MTKRIGVLLICLVWVCTACGGDDGDSNASTAMPASPTIVPTAIIETFPPSEPRPTDDFEPITPIPATPSGDDDDLMSATDIIASDIPLPTESSTSEATPTLEVAFPTVFQDQYPVNVSAGQTLVVNYNVTLNNTDGRIFILVRDSANAEVSRFVVTETANDALEVEIATSGVHTILVAYENLDGNYSVSYEIR